MHCPASFSQIESDLSVFPSVDPDYNAHEILKRFGKRHSLCHYTIKNNQVHTFLFQISVDCFKLLLSNEKLRLIASKIKVSVYIIYVCVCTVYLYYVYI